MPAYKNSKVLGTLKGGVHSKGTAPVAGMMGTQGARTTDKKMVGSPTVGNPNDTYTKALGRDKKRGGLEPKAKAFAKGGSVKKMASGGSAKQRPYDAMRDESSRAITAMPYTETKPKPKAKSKAPPPKAKGRPYDPVKDEPTSRPFKRGGSVKMAAGGKVYSGTFSEAFRAARKDGVSNFKWAGKKGTTFTTEMEGEKPAAKPTAKPATPAAKPASTAPASSGTSNYDAFKTMTGRTNTEANKAKDADKWNTNTNLNRARLRDIRTESNRAEMRRNTVARSKQFKPASAPSAEGETPYQMAKRMREEDRAARGTASIPGRKVTGRPGQALKRGGKVKKKYV